MKRLSLLVFAALLMGVAAQADVLFEPYVSEYQGKITQGPSSHNSTATVYGGRLGFGKLGFTIGVDLQKGNVTEKASPQVKLDRSDLGAFVSYDFPLLVRVFGTYFWSAKDKDKTASNEFEGTSYRLGVGFRMIHFISINFEYQRSEYDEMNSATLSTPMKDNYLGVGVSLPLRL